MKTVAAVVQAGSTLFDTDATIARFGDLLAEAKGKGAEIAVFPEAFIGGYPKGVDFGLRVGSRTPEGRELFRAYAEAAVVQGGARAEAIAKRVKANGLACVLGVIERVGDTLYCSAFIYEKDGALLGVHRKLMPTAMERCLWGMGGGADLPTPALSVGRVAAAICWENYMPLLRSHYYAAGVELYCAPTVDDRDVWASAMRMVALEGRCFVLSACQFMTRGHVRHAPYEAVQGDAPETVLIGGGSCIVSPMGEMLAGPMFGEEGVLVAELDRAERIRGKFDLDVAGHYARPDVFHLSVDTRRKPGVAPSSGDGAAQK